MLAVLSPDYLVSKFGSSEWMAAFRDDPLGERRALLPVRIATCDPGPLLNTRVYLDLVGLDEAAAQERLLEGVDQAVTGTRVLPPAKRVSYPGFPGKVRSQPEPRRPEAAPTAGARRSVLDHVQRLIRVNRDPDLLLHTLHGLGPKPGGDCPATFETIYYLWADAEGSSISAQLEESDPPLQGPRHFSVRFSNARGTYPGNIAFRPGGTSGLDNASSQPGPNNTGKRYLSFEARRPTPASAAPSRRPRDQRLEPRGPGIALAYRVIDRLGTHWRLNSGNRVECVVTEDWAPFHMDLAAKGWSVFYPDGNYRYARSEPDFSLIVAAVIEFGGDAGARRPPGEGHGTVQLRNFRLRNRRLRLEAGRAARGRA